MNLWSPRSAASAGLDKPKQIVAYVNRDLCSLAAVRAAVPHATGAGLPLVVAFQRPPLPIFAMMASPIVVNVGDDLEADTFARVAAIIAPYGLPWDFRPVSPPLSAGDCWQFGEPEHTLVIAAGHRARHLPFAFKSLRAARTLALLRRTAGALEVVGCDRRLARCEPASYVPPAVF